MNFSQSLLKRLWSDQRGIASINGMILVTAVVAIGGIVGLVAVRDHVTQQMGDIAVALDNLDQSFSYSIMVDGNLDGDFTDLPSPDFLLTASYSDPAATLMDDPGDAPACLSFSSAVGTTESTVPPTTGEFP